GFATRLRRPLGLGRLGLAGGRHRRRGFASRGLGIRCRRRLLRRRLLDRRALRDESGDVLVLGGDDRDDRPHVGGVALGDEMLAHHAGTAGDKLHRGLVGLHLRQDVALVDGLAFLLQPGDQASLLHRRRERFHVYFGSHGYGAIGYRLAAVPPGLDLAAAVVV